MIAALPFYELRMVSGGVRITLDTWSAVVPTGGIPVDPWATLVCLGILLGLELARSRGMKMGFEPKDVVDGVVFTVLFGFLIAHVFTVLFYYPERLAKDGIWSLLKVWEGFSSTGGFVGGVAGLWIFYRWIRPRDVLRFADLIAYGFPVGWLFGRIGCGVVHDHIGAPTTFPLAVTFPADHFAAGVRHELGLYEALLTLPMVLLWHRLGQRDRPPGFFLGLFFALYAPMRFGLDFLRNADLGTADPRYLGLTPAQWAMFAIGGGGAALVVWAMRRPGFVPYPLDGSPPRASPPDEAADAG